MTAYPVFRPPAAQHPRHSFAAILSMACVSLLAARVASAPVQSPSAAWYSNSAVVGATAGGLVGHLRGGISRGDLKELGEELEAGNAAVLVIGESKIEEELEKAATRANKLIEKQIVTLWPNRPASGAATFSWPSKATTRR